MPLLKERPGALDHAKPFKTWSHPAILDLYLAELRRRYPQRVATIEFLRVLEMCRTHPIEQVAHAAGSAMVLGSLGADTVTYLLRMGNTPSRIPAPATLASAPPCPPVQERDLRQYNLLLRR